MNKKKIKLEDGTEIEIYDLTEVDTEIGKLNQTIQNRIEQTTRLQGEVTEFKTKITTLEAEKAVLEPFKTELETLKVENEGVKTTLTSKEKVLKAFELYAGVIPNKVLKTMVETSLFTSADYSTDEGLQKLDAEVKSTFEVYFKPASQTATSGGTGGGGETNALVTKVEDLKGKSYEEINAGLNALKGK
jgi:FtsZ-binding cell division protein ZapB